MLLTPPASCPSTQHEVNGTQLTKAPKLLLSGANTTIRTCSYNKQNTQHAAKILDLLGKKVKTLKLSKRPAPTSLRDPNGKVLSESQEAAHVTQYMKFKLAAKDSYISVHPLKRALNTSLPPSPMIDVSFLQVNPLTVRSLLFSQLF
jgi:hypothetical protein